jgi:3-oxoacyl-[acyl-carrier protein] reductase
MSLQGKIALVTGASRGIGQAIALELGQHGAVIIGTATTTNGAEAITQYFHQQGILGCGTVLNLSDAKAISNTLETIQASYGAPAILVNNAGITQDNLLLRMRDEEWDKVIEVNLSGVYRLTNACLKGMVKARWGRIISLSSVVGAMGNAGQANYAAAKAGIIGFTKSIAIELASRNITANVVAPGFIDTDMTRQLPAAHQQALLARIPLQRMGLAEEVANAVGFLASEKAGYITGVTLHINGGMYMQ